MSSVGKGILPCLGEWGQEQEWSRASQDGLWVFCMVVPWPHNGDSLSLTRDCLKERRPARYPGLPPTDVNECLNPGVCAHGRCYNLEGSFRCSCEQGYEVTSDGKTCQGTGMLKQALSTAHQPAAPSLCTHIPNPPWSRIPTMLPNTSLQVPAFPLSPPRQSAVLARQSCRVPHRTHGLFQMSTSVPAGPRAPQVSASTRRAPSPAQPARLGTG